MRLKKGWLQDQTARTIQLHGWDISREQYNRLENQARRVFDTEAEMLADIFGVGIQELYPRRKVRVGGSATGSRAINLRSEKARRHGATKSSG